MRPQYTGRPCHRDFLGPDSHVDIIGNFLLISRANITTWNNDFLQHSIQRDSLRSLHDGPDVRADDGPDPADDEDGEDDGLYDDVRHAGAGEHQAARPAVSSPLQCSLSVKSRGGDADQEDGGEARLLDRQDEQS